MHVHFIRHAIQFHRQIFNRRLNEQNVRSAAFRSLPVNLLRNFLEWACVGIDPDVKLGRVPASRLVHKAPVSRPDVDDHPFAGRVR